MGCFNVSCGISGISMYCDDAVLIPLLPARYAPRGEATKNAGFVLTGANIVSNEGVQVLYYPMTLPIFGNMDSYGRLENIEKDANTECIEKFFDMDISKFADSVASGENFDTVLGWKKFDDEYLKYAAGMYVHREIWDHFSAVSYDEFGKPNQSAYDDGYLTDEALALVGFRFVAEDKSRQRYNRLMTRVDMPEVQIYSDDRWIELFVKGKQIHSTYCLRTLVEAIEANSEYKFAPAQIRRIKENSRWEPIAEAEINSRNKTKGEIDGYKQKLAAANKKKDASTIELYTKLIEMGGMSSLVRRAADFYRLGDRYNEFSLALFEDMYGKSLKAITPLLIKHHQVQMAMFGVNRMYMPTFNGYQHGNDFMSKSLYEKSLEIVTQRIKEQEEDE